MGEAKRQEQARQETQKLHYDLVEAERVIRAGAEQMRQQGEQLILEGKADATFVHAQQAFYECRVQFTLAGMAVTNQGIDRNEMLSAAAGSLGMMYGMLIAMCIGNRERSLVLQWFQREADLAVAAPKEERVTVQPTQAGHA